MQNNVLQLIIRLRDEASKELRGFAKGLEGIGDTVTGVGSKMAILGAAPTAALALASKSAITFEDSLANVRKTAGLTAKETQAMGDEILKMSKNTRTSIGDLTEISRIGGQLGVAKDQMISFTDAINKANVSLGDEFLGGAEQVASELGMLGSQFKLVNKDGSGIGQVMTNIGSAINSLGASGIATGPYITDFTKRVGGIAPTVGLSIGKVMGLAAAMQELGQSQEVAGTATQGLILAMGKNSEKFAEVAGVSGAQFSKLLKTDINEALLMVAKGVATGSDGIQELAGTLNGLGIDGNRAVSVLAAMGNNTDLVREKQQLATEEYRKGSSLLQEYNIKNNTAAANVQKFMNNINRLGIIIGTSLLPAINNLLDKVVPVFDKFANFASQNPQLITGFLLLGAAIGILGTGLVVLGTIISSVGAILAVVTSAAFLAALPWIALGVAIVALGLILWHFRDQIIEVLKGIWTAIVAFLTPIGVFIGAVFMGVFNTITYVMTQVLVLIQYVWMMIQAVITAVLLVIWDFIGSTMTSIWNFISTTLSGILQTFDKAFGGIFSTISNLFGKAYNWLKSKLDDFAEMVSRATSKVTGLFESMADGIMGAIRKIKFPHLSIGEGMANVAGHEIKYPKLDVAWYEKGGWVNETGLAVVHEGEYVLSRAMLEGREVPEVGSQGANVNMNVVVNSEMDWNVLNYKLAYAIRNA